MYRDFQARNIMIHDDKPWFIDYQGGRRGPLQYDLASLLFQVKAALPYDFREEMLHWYLANLEKYIQIDTKKFVEDYYGFVLIRLLQVRVLMVSGVILTPRSFSAKHTICY